MSSGFVAMSLALQKIATILPGHRLELDVPEVPEGTDVDVIVIVPDRKTSTHKSALEYLNSLPAGPRAYGTWDEYERHLAEERGSWER